MPSPRWYDVATGDESRELAALDDIILATRAALRVANARREFLASRLRERLKYRTLTPQGYQARLTRHREPAALDSD